MKASAYLVFPNSILSVLPEVSSLVKGEPMEHGIITSVTHGAMSGMPIPLYYYYLCPTLQYLRNVPHSTNADLEISIVIENWILK